MWQAIRDNLYFFLAAFVVAVIFIVYMLATQGSSSTVQFVGLMMAMGNTYGVLLIICLLGTCIIVVIVEMNAHTQQDLRDLGG